ncbi:MAG: methyltransferase domain-containing protein [Burkholderiales bacterium]|jgi:SAM-dependent methyltransferase|nr:methyltransferase domain-containing protein [Burkholderiales bacterium]
MGDYSNMASYYDVIMTSGYYDYAKIVDNLVLQENVESILEIGCGTGLILQELIQRKPHLQISGIDLTASMLAIAQERLKSFSNIVLSQQNVCDLHLPKVHDLIFSYGGVWYFVVDGDSEPFLVSHIAEHEANVQGIEKMAQHLSAKGDLLLGIQGPHHDYETVISNGTKYSQKIDPTDIGFTKHYYLFDGSKTLMAQTVKYRTYKLGEVEKMLSQHGLIYQPETRENKLFLRFSRA